MIATKSAIAIPLACCLLLAVTTPLASARNLQQSVPQPVVSGGTFGGSVGTDLNFKFALGGNTVSANMAPALKLADLTENAFSLKPCTFFQTHFHPNATEVITNIKGEIKACTLLNGKLECSILTRGVAFVFPQAHVHFFFNEQCDEAENLSALDSSAPGAFFYDSAKVPGLISGNPTASDVKKLISSQVPVSITTMPQTFVPLLNCGCKPNHKPAYKPPYVVKGQGGNGGNGGTVHQKSDTNQSGHGNSATTTQSANANGGNGGNGV